MECKMTSWCHDSLGSVGGSDPCSHQGLGRARPLGGQGGEQRVHFVGVGQSELVVVACVGPKAKEKKNNKNKRHLFYNNNSILQLEN